MRAYLVLIEGSRAESMPDPTPSLVAEFGEAVPIFGSSWLIPWEADAQTLTSRIRERLPFFRAIVATDVSHDWYWAQITP